MVPMRPADRPTGRPTIESTQLDAVLQQIEADLPVILKLCRARKKQKRSPTATCLGVEAKNRLRELCEDPVISADGTDVPLQRVNGIVKSED